jgi:hypothetical protein
LLGSRAAVPELVAVVAVVAVVDLDNPRILDAFHSTEPL